jgi:rare lipoprotein A (peptidoglycan hydrolase)
LRPKLDWRAATIGGALVLAYACAAAVPAAAPAAETQGTPTATASKVDVSKRKLNVRMGRRALVRGRIQPAGSTVALQISRRGRWITLDRDRTDAAGAYVLRDRVKRPQSVRVRVKVVDGGPAGSRRLGRLNVYRSAYASWYGPGLYGGHLSCGGTLDAGDLGVAHKSLPCGTKVTLRHGGKTVRVPVIDRGPYVGGREFDLTAATAQRLGFSGHGAILTTR